MLPAIEASCFRRIYDFLIKTPVLLPLPSGYHHSYISFRLTPLNYDIVLSTNHSPKILQPIQYYVLISTHLSQNCVSELCAQHEAMSMVVVLVLKQKCCLLRHSAHTLNSISQFHAAGCNAQHNYASITLHYTSLNRILLLFTLILS